MTENSIAQMDCQIILHYISIPPLQIFWCVVNFISFWTEILFAFCCKLLISACAIRQINDFYLVFQFIFVCFYTFIKTRFHDLQKVDCESSISQNRQKKTACSEETSGLCGANGGNRTHDLLITSELLYP